VTGHIFLHGFGARYDLPGPLFLYLFAAAGVVVLSFVMVVLFAGDRLGEEAVAYRRYRTPWLDGLANSKWPRVVGGAIGVLTLLAVIVTGLFGSQAPFYNPAEYLVWVYFWAGTVILVGLVGNVWTLLNPWSVIHSVLSRLTPLQRRRGGYEHRGSRLGIWPAVATYFAFACLELTSGVASRPAVLAWLTLAYTVFTLAGIFRLGADAWLSQVECFTVLFEIVSRFGPVETERGPDGRTRVHLRIWGTGLLKGEKAGWDRVVFVVLMLSTLAFDGILATPVYRWYLVSFGADFDPLGPLAVPVLRTIGLLLLTAVFLAAFVLVMRFVLWFGWPQLGSPLSRWKVDEGRALSAFALTLVPIALVYNAAHNYTYVVVQSQGLIPLLADPFHRGWHLLPTAGYQISFALAGAAIVWYVQIVLIVLGHVIAVYLSHLRAGERFKNASQVLLSQYPMLGLMVLYTMTSLWILAQPITREV